MVLAPGHARYRFLATACLCWMLAATAYGTLRFSFGPRPVFVHVRWSAAVEPATRQALEQRHGLWQGELRDGRTWGYELVDPSRNNIRALVQDASVEDTHYIHRTAFRPWRFAPWRPYVTARPSIPVALEVLVLFLLLLGCAGVGLAFLEWLIPGAGASLRRVSTDVLSRTRVAARWMSVGYDGGWGLTSAAACVFAVTALLRYLAVSGFSNDHFEFLAGAQQILHGEWPSKDFVNPGRPLMYGTSAAAQLLFGRTLFAEAVLTSCALGAAAAITLIAAFRLSRSAVVAAAATILAVAIFPRPYNYSKVLVTAMAPLVILAWMNRPRFWRMYALAATVAVAFLFRHDLGLDLGVAALVGIVLVPTVGYGQMTSRVAAFCGLVALMIVPYVIYLEMTAGLSEAMRNVIDYGLRHVERTHLNLANLGWSPHAQLYYLFHALPCVALLWLFVYKLRGLSCSVGSLLPVVVLAIVINVQFLRDPLSTRLADAAVPNLLVAAWLVGRVLQIPHRQHRLAALALTIFVGGFAARAVLAVGNTREELSRTGLIATGVSGLPNRLREQTVSLQARYSTRQLPDSRIVALFPFFEYLDRCTTQQHRLLVGGYAAEIYVYSRRMFAAGQYAFIDGYYTSEADQQLMLERMRRQLVPFAVLLSDQFSDWRKSQPAVVAYVESRYVPMTDVIADDYRTFRILRDPGLPVVRIDSETGWPCYR